MVAHKKGQVWNKAKTAVMKQFEKEKGANAVYRGKITGKFEYWLWQQEKKKTKQTKQPKKPRTTKLSATNKEKIKKLERKIGKLEDKYAINPSERYDTGSEIDTLYKEISKLQPKKRIPPQKPRGKPLTKEEKIQDILSRENIDAVGVVIEVEDILYFKSGRIGAPFKVIEKKLYHGTPMIQLRNLKTGRLTEKPRKEFVYLLSLSEIDKGGKEYKKRIRVPDAKTWNNLSQKRRFIFLDRLNYKPEVRIKYMKMTFRQLPIYVQRQMAFQVNGSNIDYVANMDTETINKKIEKIKDIESREKDNYYCTKDKYYHYQGRGKLYKEHKQFAKKGSKKPLYKVHIGEIHLKDLDIRLQRLINEYRRGINYYHIESTINQDLSAPREYNPSYLVKFRVKHERGNWKDYSQMGWQWVPEEHKFMEY